MKNKEEAIMNLLQKYNKVQPLMNICGVDLVMPSGSAKAILMKHLKEGVHWLDELIDNQWRAANKARHCVPEATWNMYDLNGFCEELQEVILWRKTSTQFRKKVRSRSRPPIFIPSKHKTILTKEAEHEANIKTS